MKTFGLILTLILSFAAAAAATIMVDTTADNTTAGDGQCTLREAIANVNAVADTTSGDCAAGTGTGDTIAFTLPLKAKIRLKLGRLLLGQSVSITGPTTGSLAIAGHNDRVLEVIAGATTMSDVIIQRGKVIDSNTGGGGILVNSGASLTLTNCTLNGNKGFGGGIYNDGTATLTNCTLNGNTMTSGMFGAGEAGGGGIYNFNGTATLTNCTLNRNKAHYFGGGIYNVNGTATLTNCTLNRNKARVLGGGIYNVNGTATLTNTIVANSPLAGNCEGSQTITSNGHNLDSDSSCFTSGGTDLVNTDPELAPFADYGSSTETLALCSAAGVPAPSCVAASPAIDAGDDAVLGPPDNLTTDQRGLPRKVGAHVDIGAYEAQ